MIVPENVRPAMIAPPSPRHKGSERVIGINPTIVQNDVSAIGSSLVAEALTIAGVSFIPAFSFLTILSTKRIAFFTTMPNSANIPISAGKERGVLVSAKMINPYGAEGQGYFLGRLLCFVNQHCKCLWIIYNKVCEGFSIKFDVRFFEAIDQLAVWYAR